ncbi:uncharacterized protein NEMAJ01_1646 [Nematocida major]|uniref:uncharacterized protein n=1 Tax=Nematocida major TaxID=1912982 RepID=UPI002007C12B|nr:uncharacterized protein NEMAJ01_1646 [Nematocida major]KAH9386750.1 hypothetical protein NEMAJ01_1646 [Nematocida major]
MLLGLLETLKPYLGTGQTPIVVKGLALDKANASDITPIMQGISGKIKRLQNEYASASKDFENKLMDFCENGAPDCLPDVHEYKSMPGDPMNGKVALEKHRNIYEKNLVHNDPSTADASNPSAP